jgi:hypothetical protein
MQLAQKDDFGKQFDREIYRFHTSIVTMRSFTNFEGHYFLIVKCINHWSLVMCKFCTNYWTF